jgi:ketosteroid isomerase-like protein
MGIEQEIEDGRAVADRFFSALLSGDLGELEASCAPGAILWINLTDQERPLGASLPGFAQLAAKVTDFRMEAVRRRGIPGGFVEQHVLSGTLPDGDALRVVGCFIGTVEGGRITRLEEYVDGGQAGALSRLLRGT